MLSVGIHENVAITATAVDNGNLKITFKAVGDEDPLAGLNSSTDTSAADGNSTDIRIFSPSVTNFQQEIDEPEVNLRKIKEIKDMLHHILKEYKKESDISWEANKGIEGLSMSNIYEKIGQQPTMDKMFSNLITQFVDQITPEISEEKKYRVLFVRQSKAKHFPTLRRKYLNTQPFIEPMSVPAEQSKLKFTKYELEKGLNSPEKIEEDSQVGGEAQDASSLFASSES